jgi:hypothetical protein
MKLLPLLALPLTGCLLQAPDTLQFVTSEFLVEGFLLRELQPNATLVAQGWADCEIGYDLVGNTAAPAEGCDDCQVKFVIDVVRADNDCPEYPESLDSAPTGLSVGVTETWSRTNGGGSWGDWVPGTIEGTDFGGATENMWWDADLSWREHLNLRWIVPE